MIYQVKHITEYEYSEPVSHCHNEARLVPKNTLRQSRLNNSISIKPEPMDFRERFDIFDNFTTYFMIQKEHEKMEIISESSVDVIDAAPYEITPMMEGSWNGMVSQLRSSAMENDILSRQFTLDSPFATPIPNLFHFSKKTFKRNRPALESVMELNERIYNEFEYDPGFTTIATPLREVVEHRKGVCQDFAHIAIACLRGVGIPARYVSGYLETVPPEGQEKLVGSDATHAWFSVYFPDYGWVDFDPTNNQVPSGKHITTAWGRDFSDVTPLKGVIFGGGKHSLKVSVDVTPKPSKNN